MATGFDVRRCAVFDPHFRTIRHQQFERPPLSPVSDKRLPQRTDLRSVLRRRQIFNRSLKNILLRQTQQQTRGGIGSNVMTCVVGDHHRHEAAAERSAAPASSSRSIFRSPIRAIETFCARGSFHRVQRKQDRHRDSPVPSQATSDPPPAVVLSRPGPTRRSSDDQAAVERDPATAKGIGNPAHPEPGIRRPGDPAPTHSPDNDPSPRHPQREQCCRSRRFCLGVAPGLLGSRFGVSIVPIAGGRLATIAITRLPSTRRRAASQSRACCRPPCLCR